MYSTGIWWFYAIIYICTVSPLVYICSNKFVIRYPTVHILVIISYQVIEFLFSQFDIVFFEDVPERQRATRPIALLVQCLHEIERFATWIIGLYFHATHTINPFLSHPIPQTLPQHWSELKFRIVLKNCLSSTPLHLSLIVSKSQHKFISSISKLPIPKFRL